MRIRQILAMVAAAGVATSGAVIAAPPAVAAPVTSAAPSAVAQAADTPITGRTGTLTARPAGQPSTGTAARQIKKATVTTSVRKDRTQATVVLGAAPTSSDNARLRLTLGETIDGSCEGQIEYSTPTHGSLEEGWSKSGTTRSAAPGSRSTAPTTAPSPPSPKPAAIRPPTTCWAARSPRSMRRRSSS